MNYNKSIFIFCAAITFGLPAIVQSQVPNSPDKISYQPLNWKVPVGSQYRHTLSNGLIAYIAEDRSLPYVNLNGTIKYGAICDPVEKTGISGLLTNLLRTGGTKAYHSDSLDALIDLYAMKLSISAGETQISFSFSCLSEYTDTCLYILSQMLFNPTFEDKKVKKQTSILLESIAHQFDNPDPILDAVYDKAMYRDGANARLATVKTIGKITKKDLVDLHKHVFKTEAMMVSVSGDFSQKAIEEKLVSLFPKSSTQKSDTLYPAVAIKPLAKSIIINRPITQSYVRMGLPLFKRPNDEYYAVQVLNLILGGQGFTSRLGSKVRSDQGLAYVIYSSAGSNYFYPATFFIEFHTKNETASKAMAISVEEVKKLRAEGISDEELEHAKKILIDGLPSMFRSPDDIVDNYATNEFFGRSPDHFIQYPKKVAAITKQDIMKAASTYLDPANFTYTIVGDTSVIFKNDTIPGFSLRSLKPLVSVNVPDSLFNVK